ncbi:MAG: ferredoxin [Frankia sp.]|nr:ferredoxin [Frankia sp.]
MRVAVDDERCRGHGLCLTICPTVFGMSDDGYAEVLVDEVPAEYAAGVREAAGNCPERAISVTG